MKTEDIINEVISNKDLKNSPSLMFWIQKSEKNRNEYIAYKNSTALIQNGAEMTDRVIKKDLKAIYKTKGKSNKYFSQQVFFKYAAILALLIIGGYTYHLASVNFAPQVSSNKISVSEGNRSTIILSDGSEIILANGSKITYPSQFINGAREIVLEGEAYISVIPNEKKPFKVHIGNHQIEVLGTEFLVTAYPQDDLVMVDLISGGINLKVSKSNDNSNYDSYSLKPNESFILNKTNRTVQKLKVKDNLHKFWTEGVYSFKKESFASLANSLERIYHISIEFENEVLKHCEFTGAIYSYSTIKTTLDTFKKASGIPFDYKIDDNVIYIKSV